MTSVHENRVAPVRERGLKSWPQKGPGVELRRSREGAWIEIIDWWIIYNKLGSLP